MDARRLKNLTERQFNRVLSREGKIVTKSDTKEEVTILFKEVRNVGENISIYYTNDTNLNVGDIVEYKGYRYVLKNVNSIQSDVYKASKLVRCTVLLNISGRHIPMALANDREIMGENMANNLSLITKDTEHIREIKRNTQYICFGSTYKVSNIFYNDGLAHVYMERTGDANYGLQEMVYYGNTTFALSDGKVQLRFAVTTTLDKIIWSEAKIEYKSSNPRVAEIDENGWLTPKYKGVITITATCGDLHLKKNITIN